VNPGLLDLLAQSAEAQRADTIPPRPLCPCGEYPVADLSPDCALCAVAEVTHVPRHERPTARPERGPCGRIHLGGFPCPTCAGPQWVDWPTHAGWWWMYDGATCPEDDAELTLVTPLLSVYTMGNEGSLRPADNVLGLRFLDARLTPPAPPGDR